MVASLVGAKESTSVAQMDRKWVGRLVDDLDEQSVEWWVVRLAGWLADLLVALLAVLMAVRWVVELVDQWAVLKVEK